MTSLLATQKDANLMMQFFRKKLQSKKRKVLTAELINPKRKADYVLRGALGYPSTPSFFESNPMGRGIQSFEKY